MRRGPPAAAPAAAAPAATPAPVPVTPRPASAEPFVGPATPRLVKLRVRLRRATTERLGPAGQNARRRFRLLRARLFRRRAPAETRFVRYRALRDVLGALVIVGLVFGGLSAATGGHWPPVLVIESHSMMHPDSETSYGRIGSIDVGDMIFARAFRDEAKLELWVDGGKYHYGRPGSVISYAANGGRAIEVNGEAVANISIVHRVMTHIEVTRNESGPVYRMQWLDGETKTWGAQGIYFPPLGFDERFGFTPRNGYKPVASGYVTKGDNPGSNPASDQALGLSQLVDATWIEATVHGEVPWLGLGKLALQSGRTNPMVPGWERIGNAFAPVELWSMFFLVIALVILIPLSIDTHRIWRHEREKARQLRLDTLREADRGPVEFQTVLRRRTP